MARLMDYFRRDSSRYTLLPTENSHHEESSDQDVANRPSNAPGDRSRRPWIACGAIVVFLTLGFITVAISWAFRHSPACETLDRGFVCGTPVSHLWGQYSPYFSVPSEIDAAVPRGCKLTFAQVLSRHGARAPTSNRAADYASIIGRIHKNTISYGPGFDFLRTYTYSLGADQLTPFGQDEMVNSGLKFYRRYRSLARDSVPFIRAGGQDRVVHSARNFSQGFHRALTADRKRRTQPPFPYDMVVIPETATSNNTLHHSLCPAFERGAYSSVGTDAQATYLRTFAPPITSRLNTALPGANLTDADTVSLMDLCPYETVAHPSHRTLHPFCHLFTPSEWQSYDYYQSLGKWYGFGPGNPLGPTQGVGFVNELVARLTGTPVKDGTSTNRTLDGDERTFPLNRTLYADFSHDNDMMGVLGALGVYEGVEMLDNNTRTGPRENGGYAAGWAVPFAARVYVEKMRCGGEDDEEEEMVRVLVNDRVMPMKGCAADERGLCTLARFVESMAFARGNGRWDWCFE